MESHTFDFINIGIHVVAAILGLSLNILTIIIIIKGKKFGNGIKIQLVNLAVANILCSLSALVPAIVDGLLLLPNLNIGVTIMVCDLLHYAMRVSFQASLTSSTSISLERFVAVYRPIKIREYRCRHIVLTTITIWILSIAVNIQLLFKQDFYSDYAEDSNQTCIFELYVKHSPFDYISDLVGFFLPLITIVTSYLLICIRLKRRKVIGEQPESSKQQANHQVSF